MKFKNRNIVISRIKYYGSIEDGDSGEGKDELQELYGRPDIDPVTYIQTGFFRSKEH